MMRVSYRRGSIPTIVPCLLHRFPLSLMLSLTMKSALMSMKSFAAPGPDGFHPFFFNKYWDKVGDSLWNLVKRAFEQGQVDMLIVLIPKVDRPSTVKVLRPISLLT